MTSSGSGQVPCPMCGSDADPTAARCGVCGFDLAGAPSSNAGGSKCARCGSIVPGGYAFCPVCGLDQRARRARPPTSAVAVGSNEVVAPDSNAPGSASGEVEKVSTPHAGHRPETVAYGLAAVPVLERQHHPESVAYVPAAAQPIARHPVAYDTPAPQPAGAVPQPTAKRPSEPIPAQTGRTVFVDGPPRPRPPLVSENDRTIPVPGKADVTPQQPESMPFVQAHVVLVGRDGEEGERFTLPANGLSIGRRKGDICFPDDPFMSPVHARVERVGMAFKLVDLESSNGIYLRIHDLSPVFPGDHFMVGHQVLRLENVIEQVQESPANEDGTRVFGTPLKPAWGKLQLVGRGKVVGDTYFLRGARVIFGREQGDILFPQDPFVSREHARLRLELQGSQMSVFLEDLGSANGTYTRIRGSAELQPRDTFRIGDQILRLHVNA